jgi:ABC-type polysaccharide/polyol phosphate export permease
MIETGNVQDSTHPTRIITPPRKWMPVDLHELWDYREPLTSFTMRDIRYTQTALGFLWAIIQPLFMMIIYSASMLPESIHPFYGQNPMAGVIEGFQWALLGTEIPGTMLFVSVGVIAVLLVSGMFYFRRMEQYYADIV